ncbi:MAG: hypothetical protein OEZ39_08155 [Gammaproteobacteria bacterium]|nr:hypothetical protein [Gammaproteobacteria bacterium]MDH5651833.1 hypothetical protein [Gammaproteobacteria bacterium]
MKLLFAIIVLLFASNTYCKEKLQELIPVLELYNHKTLGIKNEAYCRTLLSDFKNGKISIRSPRKVLSRDELLLSNEYFGKCNPKSFVQYSSSAGHTKYVTTLDKIDKKDSYKLSWNHANRYIIFNGDIDHDGNKEYILYGSCIHKDTPSADESYEHDDSYASKCNITFSNIQAINTSTCRLDRSNQVFDIDSKYNTSAFVGIFSRNNKDYYYDGRYEKQSNSYYVRTFNWIKRKRGLKPVIGVQCYFMAYTPDQKMK